MVVIIGILAAIAIPEFATTKDKAKLTWIKTDIRNQMTAQGSVFLPLLDVRGERQHADDDLRPEASASSADDTQQAVAGVFE